MPARDFFHDLSLDIPAVMIYFDYKNLFQWIKKSISPCSFDTEDIITISYTNPVTCHLDKLSYFPHRMRII